MDMTGAAVNRTPCSMVMKTQASQVLGNRIGAASKICVKPRRDMSGGFRDMGHVLYYKPTTNGRVKREKGIAVVMTATCGDGLVTEKSMKKDEKKKMKMMKMKKLFKGLAELVGEDDPEGISKAAETLLQHLEEMKRKEKELKKKRKIEKSVMKAAKAAQCQSSSSLSLESRDSECGEVVDLKSLQLTSSIKPGTPKSSSEVVSVMTPQSLPQRLEAESCKLNISNVEEKVDKRIEVCMGGKCKKSGAAQLVEEFEKIAGEGAVVGCKCMGKCRDGPNVRVSSAVASDLGKLQAALLSPPTLCIGVGLEDVGVIVANFYGGVGSSSSSCSDHVSLAVAAAT